MLHYFQSVGLMSTEESDWGEFPKTINQPVGWRRVSHCRLEGLFRLG